MGSNFRINCDIQHNSGTPPCFADSRIILNYFIYMAIFSIQPISIVVLDGHSYTHLNINHFDLHLTVHHALYTHIIYVKSSHISTMCFKDLCSVCKRPFCQYSHLFKKKKEKINSKLLIDDRA